MDVDERSEVSFSIPQRTLPWQAIFGLYPQNFLSCYIAKMACIVTMEVVPGT